jgi:hypothetical protein
MNCSRSFIQPEVQRSVVHRALSERMHEYYALMTNVDAMTDSPGFIIRLLRVLNK